MNILLQMDDFAKPNSMRYYIEHNNPQLMESLTDTEHSFSGTPENLFNFAAWSIQNYPALKHCLVLWNHGAGIKDPGIWGRLIGRWRDEFFVFNKSTGLLELDRSLVRDKKWLEHLQRLNRERGIAFNDVAEAYLTNQDLKAGLENISINLLGGKKLDILAMDACHMAMVEIASQIKKAVTIMVASQEVEPGTGYDYALLLNPHGFNASSTPHDFAKHIVTSYDNQYRGCLADYTQSAIDLTNVESLEQNIDQISGLLLDILAQGSGFKSIKEVRFSRTQTTEFLDNDYIDLYHFYKSLNLKSREFSMQNTAWGSIWSLLAAKTLDGMNIINSMVIANASGVNLPHAHGLSIYFPLRSMHASYYKTVFAQVTRWPKFLERFIELRKMNMRKMNVATKKEEVTDTKTAPVQNKKVVKKSKKKPKNCAVCAQLHNLRVKRAKKTKTI
jgi:hypothetical protein